MQVSQIFEIILEDASGTSHISFTWKSFLEARHACSQLNTHREIFTDYQDCHKQCVFRTLFRAPQYPDPIQPLLAV